MRKFKKAISIVLLVAILLPLIPIGEIKALAAGINIEQIVIDYSYKDRDETKLEKIYFNITGTMDMIGSHSVTVKDSQGNRYSVDKKLVITADNTTGTMYFDFEITPKANTRISEIIIAGKIIEIPQATPKITKMQTYDVLLGDNLRFEGENLTLSNPIIEGLPSMSATSDISFNQQINTGNPGYKNINFKVTQDATGTGIDATPRIIQSVTYPNMFKLIGNLKELGTDPADTLEVIPAMGEAGSIVYIRANNGQFNIKDGVGEYSVFFLTDTTDKYSVNNMAEIISYSQNRKIMKVRVPKAIQDSTSYEIQVTNKVTNPRGNIDEQILERKSVKNRYFVIGSDKSPIISSITPPKGPDTGEIVRIGGKKFDEIDFIDGLENSTAITVNTVTTDSIVLDNTIGDIMGSEGVQADGRPDSVFKISYNNVASGKYNGDTITSINRYIAVYVGDRTTPHMVNNIPAYFFDPDPKGFDSLTVTVPAGTVSSEKQVNVIMVMQTEIVAGGETYKVVNVVNNDSIKYTIIPSFTRPTITKIIPEQIQVVDKTNGYGLKEDMVISIVGQNFKVLRTTNSNSTKDITTYPVVGIGANLQNSDDGIVLRVSPDQEGQVEIYKNNTWTPVPGAKITVLDDKGNIIDGTIGKDTGTKIIVTIPKTAELNIPESSVTTDRSQPLPKPVYVMNPVLGTQTPGEAVSSDTVSVMFIDLKDNPSPTIDRVTPNIVAIDSAEEVVITGSNFQQGIRVFVGGVEVTGVKQELDASGLNTTLRFNAPKFPQIIDGTTKIMVMNPDGGIAVKDFTFVKSMQRDPVFTGFSPKSGTLDTVVIVDGDNFLAPNPSVTSLAGVGMYRLLGSRILMDGKDINDYNRDSNGNIILEDYTNSTEMLITAEGSIAKLSTYAHSIVLEDSSNPNKFYTIYTDNKMNVILSDGGSGTEENNVMNQFNISADVNDNLIAEKDGQTYNVSVSSDGIVISKDAYSLTLKMRTPYKADGEDLYGSRVHVIDKSRIEFRVPALVSKLPGGYTITVENPDTKKATAKDVFYYYETVSTKPQITNIRPSLGSIDGGYQILIEGTNFEDTSKVYVDGVLLSSSNIRREIINGVDTIVILSMPAYRRNMNLEGTDRKQVPITIENGDGGTAISRFTYVIPPSAKPIIDKAEFQSAVQIGTAAGEEILTITGKYFKFEEPWALSPKYAGWIKGERNGVDVYYEDLDGDGKYTSYSSWIDYTQQNPPGALSDLPTVIETYEKYLTSPVLPTVRIGGVEAKIVEFGDGYIRIVTPKVSEGKQELYVVNNDFGTSNRVNLTFASSKIVINRIVGDTGKKQGNDAVEISGSGFKNTRIYVMEEDVKTEYNIPLVRFGTVGATKDILNNLAQVVVENGDFTVDYNNTGITTTTITMTAKYNKEIYKKTFTIDRYDGSPIYLPTWELKTTDGKEYPGYELVKVEVINRRLIVSKGYSPEAERVNGNLISLKTPSYYTIGEVQVEVTNADGGRATTKYKYTNPASKPYIINITRDGKDPDIGDDGSIRVIRMDYRGGQNITVLGEDFRDGATIQIGNVLNIPNANIIETLGSSPNKLSFVMPEVNESAVGNLYRLTVINGDGAQTSSDSITNIWATPIYIQFIKGESDPALSLIEPAQGPSTGGTKVKIKGKDFRSAMEGYGDNPLEIYFGDTKVPQEDILSIKHNEIELIVPKSASLGPVKVKIENPDGTATQDNIVFTYISKPTINDVTPKKIFTNDTTTVVTLEGTQFLSGAMVIIGGELILQKDIKTGMDIKAQGITKVDKDGNNVQVAVVGGYETATTEVVNNNQIKVTFAEVTDLENTSIIVINPDGGISDPYNDFQYELPVPLKPMVLEGIPGYETTVMLIWNESDPELLNRATEYEIYGRKSSDKANTYIGTTTDAQYLIKGLEPNTKYTFMVRALNEYGSALDFATVQVRTLSLQEDYKQKEKEDELKEDEKNLASQGKEVITGNKATVTIGTNHMKNSVGLVDLTASKYKNVTEFTINVPLAMARKDSTLTIKDNTLSMSINPKDMYTYRVSMLDEGDKDANFQIVIKKATETNIPRGKKVASNMYDISYYFQSGKNTIEVDRLVRSGKLAMTLDDLVFTNTKNVYLGVLNPATGQYEKVDNSRIVTFNTKGKYLLISDK